MVQPDAVEAAIQQVIPDANVTVEDLTGGGDHLQVTVVSSAFAGLSRVRQHQMVYGALQQELASEAIHALALNTSCLLYTSPSPRDRQKSRMPSSA